ncbi:MAG: hypothetical protein ABEK16_01090 [Candidatus Nanohalobium sp.]
MKSKETVEASNASNTLDMYENINKSSNSVPTRTGQKLQSTVRFEADTYREVEGIQDAHGITFAETVRKLVKKGLKAVNRGGIQ